MEIVFFLIVFGIGGFLAIQAPMNGGLTRNMTHNVYSTVSIGFLLGSLLLLIIALVSGSQFPAWSEQTTQWWHWTGRSWENRRTTQIAFVCCRLCRDGSMRYIPVWLL